MFFLWKGQSFRIPCTVRDSIGEKWPEADGNYTGYGSSEVLEILENSSFYSYVSKKFSYQTLNTKPSIRKLTRAKTTIHLGAILECKYVGIDKKTNTGTDVFGIQLICYLYIHYRYSIK